MRFWINLVFEFMIATQFLTYLKLSYYHKLKDQIYYIYHTDELSFEFYFAFFFSNDKETCYLLVGWNQVANLQLT